MYVARREVDSPSLFSTFTTRSGGRIDIRLGNLCTKIAYRGEGFEVDQNTIHKIRKELELDDEHGYDSHAFYNKESRIPEFIAKYRKILERLAEYDRLEDQKAQAPVESAAV